MAAGILFCVFMNKIGRSRPLTEGKHIRSFLRYMVFLIKGTLAVYSYGCSFTDIHVKLFYASFQSFLFLFLSIVTWFYFFHLFLFLLFFIRVIFYSCAL